MNRKQILEAAAECVDGSREEDYGSPEDNFGAIAAFWSDYVNMRIRCGMCLINARDVANMMILLKIARSITGHGKNDNYVDIAGYAACAGEIIGEEEEEEACTN